MNKLYLKINQKANFNQWVLSSTKNLIFLIKNLYMTIFG